MIDADTARYFTGSAGVEPIAAPPLPSRMRVDSVTFERGARTIWHTHPCGQLLLVTDGRGFIGRRGAAPQPIGPGDTVWIEPGEWHWHGARPAHTMTHLAVQEVDAAGVAIDAGPLVTAADYPKESAT